ncbi:MAG: thioredoxin, partial [Candidatus Omnitrophota bacterium]
KEVLESDLPVLVDFWAEWCGPCRMLAPVIEKMSREYEGRLKVCKLDVDTGQQTASGYGVMNIPTLLVFKGGEEVARIVGMVAEQDLISRLNELV